jgi:hypothetical protein
MMAISDKLTILGDVGIIDWLASCDDDSALRTIVNSLANTFFEDKSIADFCPSDKTGNGYVLDHFIDSGFDEDRYDYDLEWYDLITIQFAYAVRENTSGAVTTIRREFNDWSENELESYIINWTYEWCWNCRNAFLSHMTTPSDLIS